MGVVTTLTARGLAGLAFHAGLLSTGSASQRFRRLDLRFYSPLCLALAVLAAPAARRP